MTIEGDGGGDGRAGADLALLRSTPPPEALEWVTKMTGATSVRSVEWMRGGSSVAMHRVNVHLGGRGVGEFVLRRYIRPEQLTDDVDVARHEAAVLELVVSMETPTPRLIACDPTGEFAGVPAVLMTALQGKPVWTFNLRWMRQMVEVLIDVHNVAIAPWVRPLRLYEQTSYALPRWVTKTFVWQRAIEIFHEPTMDTEEMFIHRDFHPGNILWFDRHVTGLVDWESASVGPRSMDVAHCRINLLHQGLHHAELFTQEWESMTGTTFHPWADIVTIIGLLDVYRDEPPAAQARGEIEIVLERAVVDLTRG